MTLPTYTGISTNRLGGFSEGSVVCGCVNIEEHLNGCPRRMYISKDLEPLEIKSFWDILKAKAMPFYEKYYSDQILKVLVGVNTVADLNKILARGAVASVNVRNAIKNSLISGNYFMSVESDELKTESFWDYVRKKANELFWPNAVDGTIVLNTVDSKLYVRSNGVWKTAGS